jgi:hypothetical protein
MTHLTECKEQLDAAADRFNKKNTARTKMRVETSRDAHMRAQAALETEYRAMLEVAEELNRKMSSVRK